MNYAQNSAAPGAQAYYPTTNSPAPGGPTAAYGAAYPAQGQYADAGPQIKNPFAPPPSQTANQGSLYGDNEYDPETAAQIEQWRQAYVRQEDTAYSKGSKGAAGSGSAGGANAIPLGATRPPGASSTITAASTVEAPPAIPVDASGKQKTVVRTGGGQKWEDPTLLEWGDHPRLFVGNLAGEVTDESLLKAFAKYPSVVKARVVRDKRTTKSKGFGFVSLASSDEFFQAAKEMNGKYIGSHPVLIKRAETEIKAVVKKDNNRYNKGKNNKNKDKEEKSTLSANTGAGIQKKQPKAAGQFKLLG